MLPAGPCRLHWQAQTLPVSQAAPPTPTAETAQLAQRIVQQQGRQLVRSLRILVWASCPRPCLRHRGHGLGATWWWHTCWWHACWNHAAGQRTPRSCAELVSAPPERSGSAREQPLTQGHCCPGAGKMSWDRMCPESHPTAAHAALCKLDFTP